MRKSLIMVAASSAALVASPSAAQQGGALRRDRSLGLSLTSGVDFSSGEYGAAARTDILVVPLSLRARKGRIRASATLPWLRIEGPAIIVGGGEDGPIVIDPNGPAPRGVRQGLGDASFGLDYVIPSRDLGGFEVALGARLKLATSPRRLGLSTGKADLGLVVDISRPIGKFSPFLTLGYRMPGDPTGFELSNSASISAGTSATFGKFVAIGSYDYSGATSPLAFDSHSLFGALAAPLAKRMVLTGYGTVGLSRGAPDHGVGLMLSLRTTINKKSRERD